MFLKLNKGGSNSSIIFHTIPIPAQWIIDKNGLFFGVQYIVLPSVYPVIFKPYTQLFW